MNRDLAYSSRLLDNYPKNGGGLIVGGDFSQLELRVLCALSGDPGMLTAFKAGYDLHQYVGSRIFFPEHEELPTTQEKKLKAFDKIFTDAEITEYVSLKTAGKNSWEAAFSVLLQNSKLWEIIIYQAVTKKQRAKSKNIGFGLVYGAGPEKLVQQIKGLTLKEAEKLISDYFIKFPNVEKYIKECHKTAHAHHKSWTPTFRVRHLIGMNGSMRDIEADLRKSQNSPIQGAASDICIMAIILLADALKRSELRSILCGSIHDSILTDCFPGEFLEVAALLKETMEGVSKQPGFTWIGECPLVVDPSGGVSWGQEVNIKKIDGNKVTLNGPPADFKLLVDHLGRAYKVEEITYNEKKTTDGIIGTGDYLLEKR